MPRGLNRSGDFRKGSPVTLPHTFGNVINWAPNPAHFGNAVTLPKDFGNDVAWAVGAGAFGNQIGTADLAAPVIGPNGGAIDSGSFVTLAHSGAWVIFYTLDGSTPTPNSFVYTTPILMDLTITTIKAIGYVGQTATAEASAAFTYNAPTVTSVTPATGPAAGGTAVVIKGTGFDQNVFSITLKGFDVANYGVVDGQTIDVTSGVGTAGVGDVVVTNPDAQFGTKVNGWTYS